MTKPTRIVLALAPALTLALAARDASAFFQKTTLEGTVGSDVSGVWLAVQHMMPSFRVRLDRDPKNIAPFKVGPIPKDLAPAFGDNPKGVVITSFTDPAASDKYGIFEGDVITEVNTTDIADEKDFEKALGDVKEWFLITTRRAALRFSSARIIKIEYKAAEKEVDGTSQLDEKIDVRVGDGMLPFQGQIDEARKTNKFFTPTKEQITALKDGWYKLNPPDKAIFVNGEHRIVAASKYDEGLRSDDNLKGTTFAIISTLQGNPLAGGGGRSIAIYGFEKMEPKLSGTYVESTLATAPFPISIEFDGRFEMTKIADFSNKDSEYRTAQVQAEGKKKQEEQGRNVKLAPDVPADIPAAPKDQPAVAE